jgi:hypothetical protein
MPLKVPSSSGQADGSSVRKRAPVCRWSRRSTPAFLCRIDATFVVAPRFGVATATGLQLDHPSLDIAMNPQSPIKMIHLTDWTSSLQSGDGRSQ